MKNIGFPRLRRQRRGKVWVSAALAPFLLAGSFSALGKCAGYVDAGGSVRAGRAEADCMVNSATRVGAGVYQVRVSYPLDSEIDEETGVRTYSFTQGICNASISDGEASASAIAIASAVKPDDMWHDVPEGSSDVVTYTVRTFSASGGASLAPKDQDFTLMCVDWMPFEPMFAGTDATDADNRPVAPRLGGGAAGSASGLAR